MSKNCWFYSFGCRNWLPPAASSFESLRSRTNPNLSNVPGLCELPSVSNSWSSLLVGKTPAQKKSRGWSFTLGLAFFKRVFSMILVSFLSFCEFFCSRMFMDELTCFTQSPWRRSPTTCFTTGALALQAGEPCLRRMRLVRHKDAVIPTERKWRGINKMVGKSAESQIITWKKRLLYGCFQKCWYPKMDGL